MLRVLGRSGSLWRFSGIRNDVGRQQPKQYTLESDDFQPLVQAPLLDNVRRLFYYCSRVQRILSDAIGGKPQFRRDTMNPSNVTKDAMVFSYMELRKAVGILGVALPFAVALGGLFVFDNGIQDSISSYYYTGMRNVFVGVLCAIGVFLLSYKGYDKWDAIAGDVGCVFAVLVALFPTAPAIGATDRQTVIGFVHLGSAAVFFSTLAFFCLFQFVKSDASQVMTSRKKKRNLVYKVCGSIMVACLILIVVAEIVHSRNPDAPFASLNPVFWLESLAIGAFGVSWLTKGEAILKDLEE
jgi:hypothetical protein